MEIIQYGFYGLIGLILIGGLICFIINQKKSVKEWLLLAVSEAEKALGEKTGQLKLRRVFENFVILFPIFSKFIRYETFSKWVDKALKEMKIMLKSNKAMQEYIGVTIDNSKEGDDDGLGISAKSDS